MCTLSTFITALVFCSVLHCGNALFECPVPPKSSLIYLDMARLNSLALEQGLHNSVHSPLLCLKGKDEECSEQKCCHNEVGCCLSNTKDEKHVWECGCKEPSSSQCTFSAPYAILANDECTTSQETKITACLREKRADDYSPKYQEAAFEAKNTINTRLNPLCEIIVATDAKKKLGLKFESLRKLNEAIFIGRSTLC